MFAVGFLCEESFFFPLKLLVFWYHVFNHDGSFHICAETRMFESTALAL